MDEKGHSERPINSTIVYDIVRPSEELVNYFDGLKTADIHEALGKTHAMDPTIKPVTASSKLCGPAVTVYNAEGENVMIQIGLRVAEPDDVLVIATDSARAAQWGGHASQNAAKKALNGVVADGTVRDVDQLNDFDVPVFARRISQSGATKNRPGSVNVPVVVGGTIVNPGDIIVGDRDGVNVIPQSRAGAVRNTMPAILEAEQETTEKIENGQSIFGINDTQELLDEFEVNEVKEKVDYSDTPTW